MSIEEKLDLLISEQRQLRELLTKGKQQPKDRLLSSTQVLKVLGMNSDDTAWRKTRVLLMRKYGMGKAPGIGFRMKESELNKYVEEYFSPIK